jgi:hypothetical protein
VYQSKVNSLLASQSNLKSNESEEDSSYILKDYEPYTESLVMRLNVIIDDTVNIKSKEDFICSANKMFDEYNDEIMNSTSLSEIVKQCIIENNVIRYNKFILTVKYLEQSDGTDNLKSIGSWIRKNAAILKCTAMSIAASGVCAVAVETTIVAVAGATFTIGTVVVPVGYMAYTVWAACVAATINATVCWAQIE